MESHVHYDVIVVGGGHAGCEAALAAARMKARVLLLVQDLNHVAFMPCNPSIGGPAKGHLVREISALGGEQARAADASALMIRWLNTSKGPAVRALRAQCDLWDYHRYYLNMLMDCSGLSLYQDEVKRLIIASEGVAGVETRFGLTFKASRVILATGTHLGGKVHVGFNSFPSGPLGQMASTALSEQLRELGLSMLRLKTGTPPRIHGDTIDWSVMEIQEGEEQPLCFDFWGRPRVARAIRCGILRTTPETHRIVTDHLDSCPLVTGHITGIGPRYCPSIESKVMAFPQKESHPLFMEPVTRHGKEVYVQNFSTSLPAPVQELMIRSLPGCEKASIIRPGYAIEYDAVEPTQLTSWLEVSTIPGLFCAGQINGSSGYEEAAAQGLMAGVNALLTLRGEEPVILGREEAYAGVLIDDLVTKGTDEPYRMLTSRCEHRLLLRHDNADRRLAPLGRRLGLLKEQQWEALNRRWDREDAEVDRLESTRFRAEETDAVLTACGSLPLGRTAGAAELLRRPEVHYQDLASVNHELTMQDEEAQTVEIRIKYRGYVERQQRTVEKMKRLEDLKIPQDFDYRRLAGALTESIEKLENIRPHTLGQAGRISGVTPADLQHLAMILRSPISQGDHHEAIKS